MQYMIRNRRDIYIRLNENGAAETCAEKHKGTYEYSKACNIVKSLPKQLKKMGFKVEGIPDIAPPRPKEKPKVIDSSGRQPSENVTRWIEKIGTASDILHEAIDRRAELKIKLTSVNNERINILHEIELKKSCDMYTAWKTVNRLRENAFKRRDIKDEMRVLEDIEKSFDDEVISRKKITSCINGLAHRKYSYRIVDVEDEENSNEAE